MRTRTTAVAAVLPLIALGSSLASCGGDDEPAGEGSAVTGQPATTAEAPAPTGPAATEASPEAQPQSDATGELSETDEAAAAAAVRDYIGSLNRRDAAAVCARFEPGALQIRELPRRRGDCAASLAASIGYARPGGIPVWKRTTIAELKEVSVAPDRARVTATVTHLFADRKYPSVEDDVIYLDRAGDDWLLAKPSGTLYRAVGYPEPPLRSLSPPAD